jgi:hypothetical protein
MTDDLVDRVADEMLRVRVRGGGVEHEATAAIRIALERLRDEGDDRVIEGLLSPYDLHRFFGLDEWAALGS